MSGGKPSCFGWWRLSLGRIAEPNMPAKEKSRPSQTKTPLNGVFSNKSLPTSRLFQIRVAVTHFFFRYTLLMDQMRDIRF